MPIPPLNAEGYLPPGIFDCVLLELRRKFGEFHDSDQRPRLFGQLEQLISALQRSELFEALLVDGSFVTAKPAPNDIDLIAVLRPNHDLSVICRSLNTRWFPACFCTVGSDSM